MADPYKQMLRQQLRAPTPEEPVRKRRKRTHSPTNPEPVEVPDEPESDSFDSDDFEDVEPSGDEQPQLKEKTPEVDETEAYNQSYLQFAQEDVRAGDSDGGDESAPDGRVMSFALARAPEPATAAGRKRATVDGTERQRRAQLHRAAVVLMAAHGLARNQWCNYRPVHEKLHRLVPSSVRKNLFQDETTHPNLPMAVRSRRFLDALLAIMAVYSGRFKITHKGLVRKNWNELSVPQPNVDRNVTRGKFKRSLARLAGSRDVAAQGFVALLRAVGLNARLVFSLQPPDWTVMAVLPEISKEASTAEEEASAAVPADSSALSGSSASAWLRKIRTETPTSSPHSYQFPDSNYPIFWAEVWNKYLKKWVSIDPIVQTVLEQVPMRRKSKFEPPLSDKSNQLTYVISYDMFGGAKDVTRRYSQFFNARTAKKRIAFRSDEDRVFYARVLRGCNLRKTVTSIDALEAKEFHDRDLTEGIPNNVSDFKNHPVYALEFQLRSNEVIFPKDDSSKVGTFRTKGRNPQLHTIYKRSHVFQLRSARAWYMRGRVLKIGVQSLKEKSSEDEVVRLYAEFQTKLYVPPPIVDGKVPKNAYGNIDVYTPTMLPENGALISTTGKYSMKMAYRAAKYILEIDFARAVIAFDFGKKKSTTAREGGIVIAKEYEEAMYLVLDALLEEEQEKKRNELELGTLRNWKFFLTKLRIMERLDREHGTLGEDGKRRKEKKEKKKTAKEEDESESGFEENDFDEFELGGFFVDQTLPQENGSEERPERKLRERKVKEDENRGFEESGGLDESEGFEESGDFDESEGFDEESEVEEAEGFDPGFKQETGGFGGFDGEKSGGSDGSEGPDGFGVESGGFEIEDGGFDTGVDTGVETGDRISESPAFEELPDEYFVEDENGELVYDPRDKTEKSESSSESHRLENDLTQTETPETRGETPELLDEVQDEEKENSNENAEMNEIQGILRETPEIIETPVNEISDSPTPPELSPTELAQIEEEEEQLGIVYDSDESDNYD